MYVQSKLILSRYKGTNKKLNKFAFPKKKLLEGNNLASDICEIEIIHLILHATTRRYKQY
jgi:hypothetical protein